MEPNDAIRYLNDINTSFRKMKFAVLAVIAAAVLISGWAIYQAFGFVEQGKEQVYVLDEGSVLTAARADNMAQRDLEAINHLTRFHELFFNNAPNIETINRNATEAMNLADNSAYSYFNRLKEQQFFLQLIQNNAIQQVNVDSVKVDVISYPYKAVTYLTRYYIRPSTITKYVMTTSCDLYEVQRSATNPHGLQIRRFAVDSVQEVETRNRKNDRNQ